MAEKAIENDDIVKLKPIMGIKPGIYLTVIYSIALLLILFWMLVYHGLVNYGTVLIVKTEPQGAAVRVNGVTMGTSGTAIPLPSTIKAGDPVNIEVILPGFEPQGGTYTIPGRVFGTRFFPRKYKREYKLTTNDPAAVLAQAAREYAEWSFGGEPTEAWQVPMVLSEAAYRIGSHAAAQRRSEILHAAARFATTRAALRDLTRAKFLLDNNGNAPSPVAVLGSMTDILVFLSENEGTAVWLASLLPPENAKIVKDSNWITSNQKSSQFPPNFLRRKLEISGLSFLDYSGCLISETPVSKALFESFLSVHPEWKDQYIDYFENETTFHPAQIYIDDIATGMSWYAAEAFCKWLTSRLPAGYAGYEVRLPSSGEWDYIDLNLGWEWGYDPYAPLAFKADPKAIHLVGSPERTIYGRSITSLPPDFCSPIVTFRPVIVKK